MKPCDLYGFIHYIGEVRRATSALFIDNLEKKSKKHLLDKNVLVISQHQNSKNTLLL